MHPHFKQCLQQLIDSPIDNWLAHLPIEFAKWEKHQKHGDWQKWQKLLNKFPLVDSPQWQVLDGTVTFSPELVQSSPVLTGLLKQFMPWRKGPFNIAGVTIDTEWRSDFKWNRLLPHISPLKDRYVLDVGCGSGYHLWRMLEQEAKMVIGVDPSPLFFMQSLITQRYAPPVPLYFLPLGVEDLPAAQAFDSVFSMGVFYHRRDPMTFLQQLKQQLRKGGELVLETLVVDGDENTVLLPQDRYAQMRNVWFLPSVPALELWLHRAGFSDIRTVDVDQTSIAEQRKTEWIEGHSLADFLDPTDDNFTIEGYPSPKRAVFIATK